MLHKVLIYGGGACGLIPCGRKNSISRKYHSIQIMVLIIFHILALVSSLVYGPHLPYSLISNTVSVLTVILSTLATTLIYVEILLTYEQHYVWLNQLKFMARIFRRHFQLSYNPWRMGKCCNSSKYSFYLSSIIFMSCGAVYLMYWFQVHTYFLYAFPALTFLHLRGFQLIIYVDCIHDYLKLLNSKFRSVVNSRLNSDCSHLVLDVNYAKINSADLLLLLKQNYAEIYKLCKLFNHIYGFSLLMVINVMMFDTIALCYWFVLLLDGYFPFSNIYFNTICLISRLILLCMICQCCESCRSQLRHTIDFIKKLIKTQQNDAKLCLYNEILQDFAQQILHCPIKIEGWGFFAVDNGFLLKMIVAAVTYVVILLQFRTTSNKSSNLNI